MKVFAATLLLLSTIAGSVSAENEVDEDLAKRILGQGEIVASSVSHDMFSAILLVQHKGVFYSCYTTLDKTPWTICRTL